MKRTLKALIIKWILTLKVWISNKLWLHTLENHRSRMGFRKAPIYTKHWKEAQKEYEKKMVSNVYDFEKEDEFIKKGFTWFQTDESQLLAKSIYSKIKREEKEFGCDKIWDKNSEYALGDFYQRFIEFDKFFQNVGKNFLNNL